MGTETVDKVFLLDINEIVLMDCHMCGELNGVVVCIEKLTKYLSTINLLMYHHL